MHETLYLIFTLLMAGNLYAAASSNEPAPKEITTNLPSLQTLAERAAVKHIKPIISQELASSELDSSGQGATVISREKGTQKSISRRIKALFPHANIDQVITTVIDHPTYASIGKEYIESIINEYFGNFSQHTQNELYLELAKALAIDYFMTRNLKNPDNLPPFLHQYFRGISIQDLIDYGRPLEIRAGMLDLKLHYIGDIGATDLNKIPGIEQVQWLSLRNNYIGQIAPGAFNGLTNLETVEFAGNPIAYSKSRKRERARIEAELKMVTGRDNVAKWQLD